MTEEGFKSRYTLLHDYLRVIIDQILYHNKLVEEYLFNHREFYGIEILALENDGL